MIGATDPCSAGVSVATRLTLPEFVPYMFLFYQHHFNMNKAADFERQGKDGAGFRSILKKQAALSDHEASILDQVTADCERAIADQDAKAQAVITAFRMRYPVGDLQPGVTLPPPPPELATMQKERNAIILRARDRLHAAFGEQEFRRFDTFVQARTQGSISSRTTSPRAATALAMRTLDLRNPFSRLRTESQFTGGGR